MKKVVFLVLSVLLFSEVFAQNTTADAGFAQHEDSIRTSSEVFASEEFRRGVQAYYKGKFNEAIVQFERALSYMPNDNLILDWLGKTYYKAGLEGSALSYWQSAVNNGYGGLLLPNKIEIVRERRVTGDSFEKLMRLSEAGSYSGDFNGNMIYSGPTSVLPNNDGTLWIVAYNSNELLLLNQNGKVIDRITGPINGFDRPCDIIRLKDGNLLLSETAGDRLSLLNSKGHFIKYIGSKGRSNGQMIGPLYLAQDSLGRIYVSDYGNRRIDVFDSEGNELFNFGTKQAGFKGIRGPTGIAVIDDIIYVADDQKGCIYEFDISGNFIRELVEQKTFKKPEALKVWENTLIICDSNTVYSVDPQSGALFEYVKTGNAPTRVTSAKGDVNGNVIVSDFTANEVYVMSKVQELVGGLFTQIEMIDASKFPEITLELRVENRHRQPIVGLQESNFFITENKHPVANMKFIGAANNNTDADITIVIDRSVSVKQYAQEMETAIQEIVASMGDGKVGTLRVVSAGALPVTEYIGKPSGVELFSLEALKNKESSEVQLDLALRLASNDLISAAKKRAIIFITDGNENSLKFDKYNLTELTSYMNNNSIGFSVIQLNQKAVSEELNYLVNNTFGELYYVFRPEGLGNVVQNILDIPQGIYQISYTTTLQSNFGLKFLPVEAEVYLLNRSGRDETGYFAPLE